MSPMKLRAVSSLCALMIFIVSGIIASTASAAFVLTKTECKGGTLVILCWEEKTKKELLELEGSEEFTVLSPSPLTVTGTAGTEEVKITCESTIANHEEGGVTKEHGLFVQPKPLEENYLVDMLITLKGCKLEGVLAKRCKVPVERSTVELVGESGIAEDLVFKPAIGKVFIEIPLEDNGTEKCPATVKGTHKVTGEQLCEWPTPGAAEEEHLLECAEKSGLLLGENEAHLKFGALILPIHVVDHWAIVEVG